MNGYLLIGSAAMLFSLQFLFQRQFQAEKGSGLHAAILFSLGANLVICLVMLPVMQLMDGRLLYGASRRAFCLAFLLAGVNIACLYCGLKALTHIRLSVYSAFMMLGGMFLMSAAVYYEMMPNNLVLGSLSGLVLVLVKIIPLPVSAITFALNMILLVIGYIFIGREFGVKTVLASLMLPMYLRIFEILTPHVESLSGNIVIDLVCFMIVVGAGQAVLFNMNASSGGIDIVAKLINKYLGFKIGQSITIIGVLISMAAIFVYDRETMVISLVGTLIYGQVLDRFCDGFHVRKKVSILSKEHEKIQNYIVKELRRGATIYPAYGGLDHAEHVEVVTILEKNEYGKLLSFIHETDEHAFVTVSTVNEVVGAWNTVKSR